MFCEMDKLRLLWQGIGFKLRSYLCYTLHNNLSFTSMLSLHVLKSYKCDTYNCIFILAIETLSPKPGEVICLRTPTDSFQAIFHSFVLLLLVPELILLSLNR